MPLGCMFWVDLVVVKEGVQRCKAGSCRTWWVERRDPIAARFPGTEEGSQGQLGGGLICAGSLRNGSTAVAEP